MSSSVLVRRFDSLYEFLELNGKELERGTYLVEWPDGTNEDRYIDIRNRYTYTKHDTYIKKEAYTVINYHGKKVEISVEGLSIRTSNKEDMACSD